MNFEKYLKLNVYKPYEKFYIQYSHLLNALNNNIFIEEYNVNIKRTINFSKFKFEEFRNQLFEIQTKNNTISNSNSKKENIKNKKKNKKRIEKIADEFSIFCEFMRINIAGYTEIRKLWKTKIQKTSKNIINNEINSKIIKINSCNIINNEIKKNDIINKHSNKINSENYHISNPINKFEELNKEAERLIYEISQELLQTLENVKAGKISAAFIRKTKKYWVAKENVIAVKGRIIRKLPVYVFNEKNDIKISYETHDRCISSVYFDNVDFNLYKERIKKTQNAEAIRIRWYGSKKPKIVFIERKRHEESWTGEESKKLRFQIEEINVLKYLNGEDVWENVKKLNGEESYDLYQEIQTEVIKKRLRPIVRTVYMRNAFQHPCNLKIRISLDTELCMLRECSRGDFAMNSWPLKKWHRTDVGYNIPPNWVNEEDITRFPHGILEIKRMGITSQGDEWVKDLIKSSLVEDVQKFSKFMHGCATLYQTIEEVPYWIPQMKINILKDSFYEMERVGILIGNHARILSIKGIKTTDLFINKYNKLYTKKSENKFINQNQNQNHNSINNLDTKSISNILPLNNKMIAIPKRVEPKLHLANERIFIKWIKFGLYFATLGISQLSTGRKEKQIYGFFLITMAFLFGFYSIYLFFWRNKRIIKQNNIHFNFYDDLIGPNIIVAIYILSMIIVVFFYEY